LIRLDSDRIPSGRGGKTWRLELRGFAGASGSAPIAVRQRAPQPELRRVGHHQRTRETTGDAWNYTGQRMNAKARPPGPVEAGPCLVCLHGRWPRTSAASARPFHAALLGGGRPGVQGDLGNRPYAGRAHHKSLEAERVHRAQADRARRRTSFLEFCARAAFGQRAGCPITAAIWQSSLFAQDAFAIFRDCGMRRTRGGWRPGRTMPKDFTKLAKAGRT